MFVVPPSNKKRKAPESIHSGSLKGLSYPQDLNRSDLRPAKIYEESGFSNVLPESLGIIEPRRTSRDMVSEAGRRTGHFRLAPKVKSESLSESF